MACILNGEARCGPTRRHHPPRVDHIMADISCFFFCARTRYTAVLLLLLTLYHLYCSSFTLRLEKLVGEHTSVTRRTTPGPMLQCGTCATRKRNQCSINNVHVLLPRYLGLVGKKTKGKKVLQQLGGLDYKRPGHPYMSHPTNVSHRLQIEYLFLAVLGWRAGR